MLRPSLAGRQPIETFIPAKKNPQRICSAGQTAQIVVKNYSIST